MEELKNTEEKENKHSKLKIIIFIILLIVSFSYIYMRYIATYGFIVKEYSVIDENLNEHFNGLKIAHLSDIHYATIGKEKLESIVKEVNIIKPDIIVFTGDLYDEYSTLTEDMKDKMSEALSKLDAPLGKYAVSGNHDYSYDGYEELIQRCGFTYLNNESKLIYYMGDKPLEIVGYSDEAKGNPNYDINLTDNYKIALIHEGDSFNKIKNKNFNLVLAGHSHGGQIRLPFIGGLKKIEGAKLYYDEHYTYNKTNLYISYGLGETKYKLRAFNKPSFNLYRLYNK